MSWLRRLSNTVRPARLQREIDRELSFHVSERADQLRGEGLSEDEAVRRARIQFGYPIVQRERTRDGIVGDARERGIDRDPVPAVYSCFSAPTPFPWFLVRTSGEPLTMASAVRLKINELEPLRAVYDIMPLEQRIGGAYAQNRLRTVVLVLFAVTALSLACLGVYGTLSYVVSLRRREVGLRLALGAARTGIMGQFLGQGVRVVGLGCACGLALSVAFTRLLSGMLYGVSPFDPATLSSVVAIVLAVAALAALVPAARAALIEPMRSLREQ